MAIRQQNKIAFPRKRFAHRSRSINRYWDAEDARVRIARRRTQLHNMSAPEMIELRMQRPERVSRLRLGRQYKRLTVKQLVQRGAGVLGGVAAAAAFIYLGFVFPNTPFMLEQRARTMLEGGNVSEALRLYTVCANKDPENLNAVQASARIMLEQGQVNEAIGFLQGLPSETPEVEAMLNELVPTVHIDRPGGYYTERVVVTVTAPREDVTVHYTLTGEPVTPESPVLTQPITMQEGTTTLRVLPVADNGAVGEEDARDYTVKLRKPEAPTSDSKPGAYSRKLLVQLNCTEGDIIRYTLDGSQPDMDSQLYVVPTITRFGTRDEQGNVLLPDGGIILDGGGVITVRAIAVSDEGVISDEAVFTYDMSAVAPDPVTFSLRDIFYRGSQTLHLTTNRADSLIYYTLNGHPPAPGTSYTRLYDGSLTLSPGFNAQIHVIAVSPQGVSSEMTRHGYVVSG